LYDATLAWQQFDDLAIAQFMHRLLYGREADTITSRQTAHARHRVADRPGALLDLLMNLLGKLLGSGSFYKNLGHSKRLNKLHQYDAELTQE
jgi:hypothetical protein